MILIVTSQKLRQKSTKMDKSIDLNLSQWFSTFFLVPLGHLELSTRITSVQTLFSYKIAGEQ